MASATYAQIKRHRRQRRLRFLFKLLLFSAVVYGGYSLWQYVTGPVFAFGRITIHGTSLLKEKDILNMAGTKAPVNFFKLDFDKVRSGLAQDIRFTNTSAEYAFPDQLHIKVEERQPAIYVANAYHSYLKIDYEGVVIDVTKGIPDGKAPVVSGSDCGNLYLGDKVTKEAIVKLVRFLRELTPEARQTITEIAIDSNGRIMTRLRNKYPVYAGHTYDIDENAQLFMAVFEEIKTKNINAVYIDLTYSKPYIKLVPEKGKEAEK